MLEGGGYTAWRVGETVPPEISLDLSRLGLWQAFLDEGFLPSCGIRASWASVDLAEHVYKESPGWHIDRSRFDALIARAAKAAGSRVLIGARARQLERVRGQWRLTVDGCPGSAEIESRFIVDASGLSAFVARRLGARRLRSDSLRARVAIGKLREPVEASVVVEAVESGWWYSAPVPGGRLVIGEMSEAAGSDRGAAGLLDRAASTRFTARRVSLIECLDQVVIRSAASACLEPIFGNGWLAVGDAARSSDPLSTQGIRQALCDGPRAAFAVVNALRGNQDTLITFAQDALSRHSRYLRERAAHYGMVERFRNALFWRRSARNGPPLRI
jgi:flavin-dependent dehydrogenase